MIAITSLLFALSPAQAQDCGAIIVKETSVAEYDEDNTGWVFVNEVGAVVQLDSGCEGECQWILHDPSSSDGQGVGKLVDIAATEESRNRNGR